MQTPRFSDEKVAKQGSVWTTVNNTFYWMKTGTDDFVCYAPYGEGTPAVSPTSISWGSAEAPYAVRMDNPDLMYADKALNQTGNAAAGAKTADPVPVLFHHALSKLAFQVKANFLTDKDKTTDWEVTLKSAVLSGIRDKGTLSLTLPAGNTDGKWPLPESGADKLHIWAPAGTTVLEPIQLVSAEEGMKLTTEPQALYAGEDGKAKSFFVLPQELLASTADLAAQQLTLEFHIKTTLPTKDDKGNRRVLDEDYKATFDLRDISSLKAWQINQNILYTIRIKPTLMEDPNSPDDPSDVTVTFDPAVVEWEDLSADATIQL